jgi:hypothetical protein
MAPNIRTVLNWLNCEIKRSNLDRGLDVYLHFFFAVLSSIEPAMLRTMARESYHISEIVTLSEWIPNWKCKNGLIRNKWEKNDKSNKIGREKSRPENIQCLRTFFAVYVQYIKPKKINMILLDIIFTMVTIDTTIPNITRINMLCRFATVTACQYFRQRHLNFTNPCACRVPITDYKGKAIPVTCRGVS